MQLSLTDIVRDLAIKYPHIVKERDSMRIALFLVEFMQDLRLQSVILTQKQVMLTVDDNLRAELPAGIDINGKIIISVCDCGELFTIDIGNSKCPTNLKVATCSCEEPVPNDPQCGCLCNCTTCNGTIGYVYDYGFNGYNYGSLWGGQMYYPMGRVNNLNPYGSARIEGGNILFSSDVRHCEVFMLYEELEDASLIQISPYWAQAAKYFVLDKLMESNNPNLAVDFRAKYEKQVKLNKRKIWRSGLNWDTFNRDMKGKQGLVKFG